MSRKVTKIFNELKNNIISDELINRGISVDYSLKLDDLHDWVINSSVVFKVECLPHKYVSIVSYNDDFYVVIPEVIENANTFCQSIVTNVFRDNMLLRENPGLVTFIWSQIDSYKKIRISEEDLFLKIFSQPEKNEFEISELEEFFIPFDIWQIDSSIFEQVSKQNDTDFLTQFCYKIYGLYLCENTHLLSLNITDIECVTNIKTIFERFGDIISIPIFRGLTATNWEHFFLEFYRSIERLYGFPVVKSFLDAIVTTSELSIDFELFIKNTEQQYNVKPNEEFALISLLSHAECEVSVTEFAQILSITAIDKKAEKVAKRIYKKRNSVAHWRKALDEDSLKADQILIKYISSLIISLYEIYSPYIIN